jgi:MATE family multidrug resistance protein
MTLSETLRAAGDTAWTLWARIILAWVFFLPISLLTVYVFDGGHVAAMLCIAGYIALLALVFYWRFRTGRWRRIDLTGSSPPLIH